MHANLLPLLCFALLSIAGRAQSTLMVLEGVTSADEFGAALASFDDVNADGWPDLLVGAPGDSRRGAGAGSATLVSGRSGQPLFTVFGEAAGDAFGCSVANVGDVNADGFADFAVGARNNRRIASAAGAAYLFSGRDGARMDAWYSFIGGGHYGHAVCGTQDVDGDGIRDWAAGAPDASYGGSSSGGFVTVLSGRTGDVIYVLVQGGGAVGSALAGGMDFTGDGVPDLLAGASEADGVSRGAVFLFSGATGARVRSYPSANDYHRMGQAVAALRDLDGDGVPEVVGGAPQGRRSEAITDRQGLVRLFSGASAAVLFTAYGDSDLDQFGAAVANAGDVDGDGKDDFLVGAPNGRNQQSVRSGYVRLFSGASRALLAEFYGTTANEGFGRSVAGVGNWNRFGETDLGIGRAGASRVTLLSRRSLPLAGDVHAVSLSGTNAQSLQLAAGVLHSGKPYVLLGSMSGVAPGISLGGIHLPLNFDPYLEFTLGNPRPPLIGGVGVLDAAGRAQAFWTTFPGIPPELVGTVLHHAYLVLGSQSLDFASNPVSLYLSQ